MSGINNSFDFDKWLEKYREHHQILSWERDYLHELYQACTEHYEKQLDILEDEQDKVRNEMMKHINNIECENAKLKELLIECLPLIRLNCVCPDNLVSDLHEQIQEAIKE